MEENISYIDNLILSFLNEEISESERKALEDWIKAEPSNKEYFKNIYRIWNAVSSESQDQEDIEMVLQKVKYRIKTETSELELEPRFYFNPILKWAAVVLFSCITGAMGYKYLAGRKAVSYGAFVNEITVPLGSKSNLRLPDGTEVILNAGSKLTYTMEYGKEIREVKLIGEGYFKVAENKSIPFIVNASKAKIEALGTEFNVKAYPEENVIETVLVKGSVLVSEIPLSGNKKPTKESIILHPGEKVQIFKETEIHRELLSEGKSKSNSKNAVISNVPNELVAEKSEVVSETSWKDNRWIINGTDLENLAVILSRRFNVSIHVADESLKQYRFSGTIENETIEEVFNIMKFTIPVSYTIDKGKVTWKINKSLEKVYKESY